MRILVVGGGGREHALAWRLSHEAEVIVAPGNPGIAAECETVPIPSDHHEGILAICQQRAIDLVVVGPEDPLIAGLADTLRGGGFAVYGPGADGAQLEGSKAYSKALMHEAGIPTAAFGTFTDPLSALEFVRKRFAEGRSVAVKASGNALGKGVVVAADLAEAEDAIEAMMIRKQFGAAGETIVIEDRLNGPEFSLMTIVGDHNFVSLPVSQDHKRAFDGDVGLNTGGMGVFSPVAWIGEDFVHDVQESIVRPTLAALHHRGIPFRGTLFSGIMMDSGQPHCLEFNVRMGDPETQCLMLRIAGGYAAALHASATGERVEAPTIANNAAVSIVIAAANYPSAGSKGAPITIGELPHGAKLFHAGTAMVGGQLVTNGGRVLNACAYAPTLAEANYIAYKAAASIHFEGARYRTDIG